MYGPATATDELPPAQALTFQVVEVNGSRSGTLAFATAPYIDPASGDLVYQPADNTNGQALFTVQLWDTGGTANGGQDFSFPVHTLTITVDPVNDAPVFTPGPDPAPVLEDASTVTLVNWAKDIAPGPAEAVDEVDQVLTFETIVVSTTPNLAFSIAPFVNPSTGTLTYAAAVDTNGTAIVTVQLIDDGGTLHNGEDRSPIHTLTITVESVNDVPQFLTGADQIVLEDAGLVIVPAWATSIVPGAGDRDRRAGSDARVPDYGSEPDGQPAIRGASAGRFGDGRAALPGSHRHQRRGGDRRPVDGRWRHGTWRSGPDRGAVADHYGPVGQ